MDIIIEYLHYFAVFLQLITLIVVVKNYFNFKSRFLFFFIGFLGASFLIEIIGLVYLKLFAQNSSHLYNVYTFFEFNFIALMYINLLKNREAKNLIIFSSIAFNCFYLLSFAYVGVQKYTISVEYVVVSIYFFIYLRELLNSDQIVNYKKQLPFWITIGLLIFFLSSIPFQFIRESLLDRKLFIIQFVLFYMVHGCFIYGFLWSQKKVK